MLLLTGESGRALGKVAGVSWPCKIKHPCVFRRKMLEGTSWCGTALAQTTLSLLLERVQVQVRS